jgi:hypothetical protein
MNKFKLNQKTKMAILLILPLFIGGYLIARQLRKPKPSPTPPTPPPNPSIPMATGAFVDYKVITVDDPLILRESPDLNSTKLARLPKGSTIKARPSVVAGWHEHSSDGTNRDGFVSSTYVRAI